MGSFLSIKVTREELLIRQSILTEFHNDSSINQAFVNITTKFGVNSVSKSKINRWYQRFKSGDMSLFDKDTNQHNIVPAIQTVGNRDEICIIDSIDFEHKSDFTYGIIDNGRFLIFARCDPGDHTTITLFNVIRGEKQEIRFTFQSNYGFIVEAHMISNQHLLMKTSRGWFVLKIDLESLEVSKISSIGFDVLSEQYPEVIIDQLNKQILFCEFDSFVTFNLVGDDVVSNLRRVYDGYLKYPKLAGNYLYGFRLFYDNENNRRIKGKYCKIDLNTLTEESTEVSFISDDGFYVEIWDHYIYSWAGTRLYGAYYDKSYQSIFAFDSETLKSSIIGIKVYGYIRKLIVDENHFLTLEAMKWPWSDQKERSIYRFALRKPESMKNLAWFNIRRYAILFDGKDYEIVRNRFPMFMP